MAKTAPSAAPNAVIAKPKRRPSHPEVLVNLPGPAIKVENRAVAELLHAVFGAVPTGVLDSLAAQTRNPRRQFILGLKNQLQEFVYEQVTVQLKSKGVLSYRKVMPVLRALRKEIARIFKSLDPHERNLAIKAEKEFRLSAIDQHLRRLGREVVSASWRHKRS